MPDPNVLAFNIVRAVTGEVQPEQATIQPDDGKDPNAVAARSEMNASDGSGVEVWTLVR